LFLLHFDKENKGFHMLISDFAPEIATTPAAKQRPVMRMVAHDRMGGSVPVWEVPKSAQGQTISRLEDAQSGRNFDDVLNDALAYAPGSQQNSIEDEPFGFADLVDIINPLHHIPLVGTLYREMTGDTIRSSGRIVGGGLYGGFIGAAGGLAQTIITHETGNSIEGHALAALRGTPAQHTPKQQETLQTLAELQQPRLSPEIQMSFVAQDHFVTEQKPASRMQAIYRFNE